MAKSTNKEVKEVVNNSNKPKKGMVPRASTHDTLLNAGRAIGIHQVQFKKDDACEWRELEIDFQNEGKKKALYPFLYGFSAVKLVGAGCPVERREEGNNVGFFVTETKTLKIEVFEDETKTYGERHPKAIRVLWE
jgi:hypothetical protein